MNSPVPANSCRSCGDHRSPSHRPLFRGAHCTAIGSLFARLLAVPIDPDDRLPTTVCQQCFGKLREFGQFRQSVLELLASFERATESSQLAEAEEEMGEVELLDETIYSEQVVDEEEEEAEEEVEDKDEADACCDAQSGISRTMSEVYLDEEYLQDDVNLSGSLTESTADQEQLPSAAANPSLCSPTPVNSRSQHKPHQCSAGCQSRFASERALQLHICAAGKVSYACPECGHRFRSLAACDEHALRHSDRRQFRCDVCERSYKTPIDLHLHRRVHRLLTAEMKKYRCAECEYATQNRTQWRHHQNTHAGVRPHECGECGKRFRRPEVLREHLVTMHAEKALYACGVCGAGFGLEKRLAVSSGGSNMQFAFVTVDILIDRRH